MFFPFSSKSFYSPVEFFCSGVSMRFFGRRAPKAATIAELNDPLVRSRVKRMALRSQKTAPLNQPIVKPVARKGFGAWIKGFFGKNSSSTHQVKGHVARPLDANELSKAKALWADKRAQASDAQVRPAKK